MKAANSRSSAAKRALLVRLTAPIAVYESRFGSVPAWVALLDARDALSLLESSLRIGVPLASRDLLLADDVERQANAQKPLRPGPT